MSARAGRFVWVTRVDRLTPERWPDDGYLQPLFRAVEPVVSRKLTAEELTWPLDDLAEKYPPPKVTK
jgi:hypothetical protein